MSSVYYCREAIFKGAAVLVQIKVKNVDHIRASHLMPQRPLVCPGPALLKVSVGFKEDEDHLPSRQGQSKAKQGACIAGRLGAPAELGWRDC